MAAVIRVRLSGFTQKCVQNILAQSTNFSVGQKLQIHASALLNVIGQEIKMPSLSPTMSEGTIIKWLKKEGDEIVPGDVLCDIQTDKAVVSFETDEEGILAKILVPDNTTEVKVGTLIGLMVGIGEDWKSVEMPASTSEAPAATSTISKETTPSSASPRVAAAGHTSTQFGPAVRTMLEKYGLQPSDVPPSGRKGIILKDDVLKVIEMKKLSPQQPKQVASPAKPAVTKTSAGAPPKTAAPAIIGKGAKYTDIEVTNMRRVIAKRLLESKTQIPHSYASIDCDLGKILAMRKRLKEEKVNVSVNDFVIKAAALTLAEYPEVNVHWIKDQVVPVPNVDISIAVATDTGLITPIVINASRKGIEEISKEVKELVSRARAGKLKPHEFQGGSFTISNLGMFGITQFSAIINPPQCSILAVGGGTPVLDASGKAVTRMIMTLSFDERAFDGCTAAKFLRSLKNGLEDPAVLLLGNINHGKGCEPVRVEQ